MGKYLRVMRKVFQLRFKQIILNEWVLFALVIAPVFVALLALYMLQGTENFVAIYVVVGGGLAGLWSATLFEGANNVLLERMLGTLEEIVASPTPLKVVVIGNILADTTLSLGSMLFSYVLVLFFFDFTLTIANPPAFALSLLLVVVAFVTMGLMLSPLMAISVGNHIWVNAFQYPIYILGGFLFPISVLPEWLWPVSYLLTPYWAARALHQTSSGNAPWAEVLFSWSILLLLSALYIVLSYFLFQKLLHRARVEATLGLQ